LHWRSRDVLVRIGPFAGALALAAALAHAGWLLLDLPETWPAGAARPGLLLILRPASALSVPLGLLLLERSAARVFASLPFALAVARLGCVAAGCCQGIPTAAPWAVSGLHPTAAYEIAGSLALGGVAARAGARFAAPLVLGGIGALRLLIDPLRAAPALGAPVVAPAAIAAAWLGVAAALAWRQVLTFAPATTRQRDTKRDTLCDRAAATTPAREIQI
jgi:hypothetical protein